MKRLLAIAGFGLCCMVLPAQQMQAQIPIADIIKAAVEKVIKAVDLKVQRLQNKTIGLQNAQKTLENKMSALKLDEIKGWVEAQRTLYRDYFEELWKVKAALARYQRVKEIIERQVQIVTEYKAAWALFRQDKNFTTDELRLIHTVYTGMLDESLKNIDRLFLVVNAFSTQMSDGKRLEIINTVADDMAHQAMDLKEFNNQNRMISLQRASERGDIEYAKRLYGLTR